MFWVVHYFGGLNTSCEELGPQNSYYKGISKPVSLCVPVAIMKTIHCLPIKIVNTKGKSLSAGILFLFWHSKNNFWDESNQVRNHFHNSRREIIKMFTLADVYADLNADFGTQKFACGDADAKFYIECRFLNSCTNYWRPVG